MRNFKEGNGKYYADIEECTCWCNVQLTNGITLQKIGFRNGLDYRQSLSGTSVPENRNREYPEWDNAYYFLEMLFVSAPLSELCISQFLVPLPFLGDECISEILEDLSEASRFPNLLYASFDHVHSFLAIIGCQIIALRSISDHTDCQRGNPCVRAVVLLYQRDIFEAGLSLSCKIADVVIDGEWRWPKVWRKNFMFLFHLPSPLIFHDRQDKVLWKNRNELIGPFSVKAAWVDLSIPNPAVPWYKIIWFSQNIPRHAFMLWLAINKRLNTQDRVAVWNKVDELKCPLCFVVKDDHNHLFFGCDFSSRVWRFFKGLMRFESVPDNLYAAFDYMSSRPITKSIWCIIQRLVLGATVYFIWIERNSRIFQQQSRSIEDMCAIIRENVRLRLLSLKIKRSKHSLEAARIWNFNVMQEVLQVVVYIYWLFVEGNSIVKDGYLQFIHEVMCFSYLKWCFCLVMGIGDVSDDLFCSLHDMAICKMQLEGEYYNVIRKACWNYLKSRVGYSESRVGRRRAS
ncbi:RNA-directed DNA polymerase, eukaryota, reverse transcriptase zinc-binding domain protein [Tanacetum coccineum]